MYSRCYIALKELFLLSALAVAQSRAFAQTTTGNSLRPPGIERILVKPNPGADLGALHQTLHAHSRNKFPKMGNLEVIEVPAGMTADTLVESYRKSGKVRYAERDRVVQALAEPNDPLFQNGDQWHLHNIGQSGGTAGADIHITNAWNTIRTATNIIVAVLDTGIRTTHEDLVDNLWHNPSEIPGNGVDDDSDGYIDDVNGINVITGTGDPSDDHGHGTHVSGIIGASGGNSKGGCGVCWHVQLMACKFLNSNAIGLVSDAITAINYAQTKGAKIINLSWGDPAYGSQALYDAIASARDAGVIVVCACGNSDNNNDAAPLFPASFDLDNIIAVAATTRNDTLASFSSYGATTVDLGAPGESIVSTWIGADNNYTLESGTSMAAPMVAGACALAWAHYPTESYHQIINRILHNVDPLPALAGKCVTGGRLNVQKAIAAPHIEPLHETICLLSETNVVIAWPSQSGKTYQVQTRTNLTDAWQNLSSVISATSTNTAWTNDISGAAERYFIVKQLN